MPRILCVGLSTLDLVQRVDELPGPNQKITSTDAELVAGGPATGAALTASALGSPTTLLTALGRHPLAGIVGTELAQRGVDVVDADPGTDVPPPISAVAVRRGTGERSVVSRNAQGRVVDVVGGLADLVADAEVVLVDGHHPRLAVAAARHARDRGVPVLLDGGSWKPVLDELLALVDLAVCSADFRAPNTTDTAQQGPELIRRGVRGVAVTRGASPILWWRSGFGGEPGETPVPRTAVVDTLGAGDVFHGACVHAMRAVSWFDQLPAVLGFAAEVAALRVAHFGRENWLNALNQRPDLRAFGT